MNFNKKQPVKLSAAIMISFFAAGALIGCGSKNKEIGKILMNEILNTNSPPCPAITWIYSDRILSQRCIEADNYYGGDNGTGLQVAGSCVVDVNQTTVTGNYNFLFYSYVIIDCVSGNLKSDQSLYPERVSPISVSPGDLIAYQVTCYAFGEERAQNSYDFTSSGTCAFSP